MSDLMRLSGNTDCHTSDIGHWFAMTETDYVYSLSAPAARGVLRGEKIARLYGKTQLKKSKFSVFFIENIWKAW